MTFTAIRHSLTCRGYCGSPVRLYMPKSVSVYMR